MMTTSLRSRVILLAFSAFFLGLPQVSFAQCSQTLSVGANIASAVSAAANNSTICLNSGNYGQVSLFGIHRTGFVTVRSSTGVGASISPQPGDSRFMRFQSLTLYDVTVNSCSLSIEFVGNTWTVDQPGLLFDGSSCPSTVQNYLVDGDTFDRVGQATYEGRLNCRDCNTVTIRNSQFLGESAGLGNAGPTDGIQTQGGTINLTIGPNNLFSGILQAVCDAHGGAHCDSIQLQGGPGPIIVTDNFFTNSTNVCQCTDNNAVNTSFTNNVILNVGEWQIGCGGCSLNGFHIDHNTFYGSSAQMNSTTGGTFRSNILLGGSSFNTGGGSSGCVSCTISFNLCSTGGCDGGGTGDITGTPTFIPPGTIPPATWAGWQLTTGSIGHNAGHDGQDVGTNYYGPALGAPPSAPTNFRITS